MLPAPRASITNKASRNMHNLHKNTIHILHNRTTIMPGPIRIINILQTRSHTRTNGARKLTRTTTTIATISRRTIIRLCRDRPRRSRHQGSRGRRPNLLLLFLRHGRRLDLSGGALRRLSSHQSESCVLIDVAGYLIVQLCFFEGIALLVL